MQTLQRALSAKTQQIGALQSAADAAGAEFRRQMDEMLADAAIDAPGAVMFEDDMARQRWADVQHDTADEAHAQILAVLSGKRRTFDLSTGTRTVPLNVEGVLLTMLRDVTPEQLGLMIAGLMTLDSAVRVNAITTAQEFVAKLATAHGDRVADRACGVSHE